jgi:hypothetical protein
MVVDGAARTTGEIAELVASGANRLLCIPRNGPLPRRLIIYCATDLLAGETMGLVASLVRNINAEATFVSILPVQATSAERMATIRQLLDTRAEARFSHGLDLRTEVRKGNVSVELTDLVSRPEPALLVLGVSGDRRQVENILQRDVGWLFAPRSPYPLLVAHTDSPLPRAAAL